MTDRYLIIGLGNPGKKYETTRHNVGFRVVDELARRWNISVDKSERKALTGDGMIRELRVLLVKPQTYMNLSGESVRALVDFYKIPVENLIVVSDDLDLPLGTLRLRQSGSAGGQNGLKNIIQHLGTLEFSRVRVGIDRPPGRMKAADYVLQPFSGDDAITAQIVIDRAADAVETWLTGGITLAMSRHNGPVDEKKQTT
jgi:PTH1 family peptidyl-tRNA hydrolase